ncbi:MAG: SPOR domain-containing protein [Deltaproteobacteria bacterium]|nr:SPOR domain-containing protein [Deltaproteobacteria bacterium]MBN2673477.1 SPOR domain-containing protein [Deltaproteobacteria bacterium]
MQDLSRYRKKDHIEISTKYISPLVVGLVTLVGLVFAMGVLVGSRQTSAPECPEPDLLTKLNEQSGEPQIPTKVDSVSYHTALKAEPQNVPVPASLKSMDSEDEPVKGESASEREELEKVSLSTPVKDEEPVPEKIRDDEADVFTLQVGSFQDHREASLMVNRLRRAGHKSFLVRVNMPDSGVWYRVRVGPFDSKRDAWSYKQDFESKERLPAFVVKRRS